MKLKFLPFYILSILPMPVLYIMSDFVFLMVYHVIKYRRDVVHNNLKRSFKDKSEQDIKTIEKNFYKYFCDLMFETIKILTISPKKVNKRFRIKNLELIEKYYENNKHIILYAAHQGNWEWLSFLPLCMPHQGVTIYKPLSNTYFDELMRTVRERFGVICVEQNKSYKTILQNIQKGQLSMFALIGDQSPTKTGSKFWTNFMNQKTAFVMGAERIVAKTNQTAIFPAFKRIKRGLYELEFKLINTPEVDDNYHLIDRYSSLLE
ncbi:MAG: lysophospholipid acyltransferase family protein, partial [Eudoraea sp.]|uniref:lysophospholipid acyltransferase family protein n=1 Tax=Eudoraea sp. TaxID=1979955 RepID=UPI003C75C7BE